MLSEKKILIVVLILVILLWMPTINYTETDDSVVYAELAKSFASGEGYSVSGEPHAHHLPMYPIIVSKPLFSLGALVSPMLALRIISMILGTISLLAWFYLGKEIFPDKNRGYFILLFLSPMLILYTFFRGLAESPLICFSLLSIFFLLKAERTAGKKYYYLSGIFFGLAALSRHAGIILGVVYILWFFTERKKYNKHFVASMILGFFIFSLLLIENYLVFGNPIQFLSTFGEVTAGAIPIYFKLPTYFMIFLPAILIMTGILLMPFVIKGIERNKSLFILLIVFGLLFASLGNLRFRYIVPLIPFVMILVYNGYLKVKGSWKHFLALGILLNILITPYFVSGEFKIFADEIYQTPLQWGQTGLIGQEANLWINKNLPEGSILITRHSSVWSSYFRSDITMISFGDEIPNEVYVLYDHVSAQLGQELPEGIHEEVFSTCEPKTIIYKVLR